MKQKTIFISFIILIVLLMGFTMMRTNFDHLGQGELLSVEIKEDPCPFQCFRATIDLKINDPKTMNELESIFFGKINTTLFSTPKEDGIFTVIFTYEKKTLTLNLTLDRLSQKGIIIVDSKKAVYQMTSKETKRLQELLFGTSGSY